MQIRPRPLIGGLALATIAVTTLATPSHRSDQWPLNQVRPECAENLTRAECLMLADFDTRLNSSAQDLIDTIDAQSLYAPGNGRPLAAQENCPVRAVSAQVMCLSYVVERHVMGPDMFDYAEAANGIVPTVQSCPDQPVQARVSCFVLRAWADSYDRKYPEI